jgi:hypothetical protein
MASDFTKLQSKRSVKEKMAAAMTHLHHHVHQASLPLFFTGQAYHKRQTPLEK